MSPPSAVDAAIVGGGVGGAVAARLLLRLGWTVALFDDAGEGDLDLDVLLPEAAAGLLHALGLHPPMSPVGAALVAGPPACAGLAQGRWLQVAQRALDAAAHVGLPSRGPARAVQAGQVSTDSVVVSARIVLVGLPSLLPVEARPAVGPRLPVELSVCGDVPETLVPPGEHQLRLHPGGWTWALRRADGVQLAACGGGAFAGWWPASWPPPPVVRAATASLAPSLPGPAIDGLLPIGRASFAVSPLSSQGLGQALATAQDAAAVANTLLRQPDDSPGLVDWLRQRALHRAWLTWDGTAASARAPAEAWGGPVWSALSQAPPAPDDPVVARAVARASALRALHAAGRWFDTPFAWRPPTETRALVAHGAVIRMAPVLVGDTLPLPAEAWPALEPLARRFGSGRAFGDVLRELGDDRPELGRAFARLVEAGVLEPVGGW